MPKIQSTKTTFKKRNLYIAFSLLTLFAILWTRINSELEILNHAPSHSPEKILSHGEPTTLEYYFGSWSWVFYFTNISNIMFFIVTFIRIFYRKGIWSDNAQLIVGSYMIIVGLIYWGAIAPGDFSSKADDSLFAPDYLFVFIIDNLLTHTMTVIFAIILIIIGIDRSKLKMFPTAWFAALFPIFYYLLAWGIYIGTNKMGANANPAYIYSFLDFYHPYGIDSIFAAIVLNIGFFLGILGIFLGIYFITAMKWKKKKIIQSEKLTNNNKLTVEKNQIKLDSQDSIVKKRKPVKRKKTKKTAILLRKNNRYFIQKSTKTHGWELKKVGATRATFVARTKLEVQLYYKKSLNKPKGTILLEKGKAGKIRHVVKKKRK